MKSATQDRYWPGRLYPKQALARSTIPKDRYWPDWTDFGHHWPDWPDIVQTIGQTEQTLGQTVVQTNGHTEQILGQTIVQTVGQTISQTVVKINGQTEQYMSWVVDFILGGTLNPSPSQDFASLVHCVWLKEESFKVLIECWYLECWYLKNLSICEQVHLWQMVAVMVEVGPPRHSKQLKAGIPKCSLFPEDSQTMGNCVPKEGLSNYFIVNHKFNLQAQVEVVRPKWPQIRRS